MQLCKCKKNSNEVEVNRININEAEIIFWVTGMFLIGYDNYQYLLND